MCKPVLIISRYIQTTWFYEIEQNDRINGKLTIYFNNDKDTSETAITEVYETSLEI